MFMVYMRITAPFCMYKIIKEVQHNKYRSQNK